jgi:hypothetical protein
MEDDMIVGLSMASGSSARGFAPAAAFVTTKTGTTKTA